MTHAEIQELAHSLMELHNLRGWLFRFDRAKRRRGSCQYKTKTITTSHYIASSPTNTDEAIKNTLLHEIAHALVGPGHGHDRVWKAKCLEIGAIPKSCGASMDVPHKYALVCPECKYAWLRHRKRKGTWVCCRSVCIGKKPVLMWIERS